MAFGYSPKLPIQEGEDGQLLTKTAKEAIRQNVKMLVLTVPGERMMHPSFGVGLRRYMFRPLTETTFGEIATKMKEQFAAYLPFVEFRGVRFYTEEQDATLGANGVRLMVVYSIPTIGETDALEIFESTGAGTATF